MDESQLKWKVIIHMTFVVSGLLFAIMDWLGSRKKAKRADAVAE